MTGTMSIRVLHQHDGQVYIVRGRVRMGEGRRLVVGREEGGKRTLDDEIRSQDAHG